MQCLSVWTAGKTDVSVSQQNSFIKQIPTLQRKTGRMLPFFFVFSSSGGMTLLHIKRKMLGSEENCFNKKDCGLKEWCDGLTIFQQENNRLCDVAG